MCGIFGIYAKPGELSPTPEIKEQIQTLFKLSESRGKEASGLASISEKNVKIIKSNIPASSLIKTRDFKKLFNDSNTVSDRNICIFGHSRLVTDGNADVHENNQPVIKQNGTVIHNGIIVNHNDLWEKNKSLTRKFRIDTEIIPELISLYAGSNGLAESIKLMYRDIEGVASIAAFLNDYNVLLLATNNGSLYTLSNSKRSHVVFASEFHILNEFKKRHVSFENFSIKKIQPGNASLIRLDTINTYDFGLDTSSTETSEDFLQATPKAVTDFPTQEHTHSRKIFQISNGDTRLLEDNREEISKLKRCTKCLIPETFPFINFDDNGVCSICKSYSKLTYHGPQALEDLVAPYRNSSKSLDCLLPLSGGRDSTYALHYVKKVLGLNPISYTYDWGMVTDLARRNISRICAKLGIEHILISADITKKRGFIKKNVLAWLKRPQLGTIPLFMAGDKQLFYYANLLKKQVQVDLVLFGMNPLERTDFKVAFCGIKEKNKMRHHFNMSSVDKLKMMSYYGKEYLLNPSYLNASLIDTLFGFASFYFIKKDYHIFFEYIPWDENLVNDTIINEYNWETSPDTPTTWRIGDGTASFYNYIYYTAAGFSENDTFRSNQIRQSLITREQALRCIEKENEPRFESIKWYCETNGIDFESAIKIINKIPKLYTKD